MRKRIKELENYINANIPAVTVPITGAASSSWSSYLTFDDHVDARKRLWSLRCSNCSNPICKFEVNKYYDRSIPTITYNGTIEDLINKVNDKDYSTCTNCSISFQNIIINTRNINKFNQFIQTNNCVYTFEYNDIIKFVTYDLYCNVCGIHLKSIDNRTDDLLDTGEEILNKFKSNNSNSNKCINNKCNGTFTSTTFIPEKTIKQSIIDFYPFSDDKEAYCNFVKHSDYYMQLIDDLTGDLSIDINRIKTEYIGKKHGADSTCGARWVGAIYPNENRSVWTYVDVDDCKIIDDENDKDVENKEEKANEEE